MRLETHGPKPITEIVIRILIEIDDVGAAAVNREIARAARSEISDAGRGPAEHILRPKIVATETKTRSKPHDLIDFMFSETLRVSVADASRPGELKRNGRIKRNDPVVWPPGAASAVCKHIM